MAVAVKMVGTIVSLFKNRVGHDFMDLEDRSKEEDIEGKVVVITGANAGLGRVVCHQFASRGAIVVMACRDMAKAESVSTEIKAAVPSARLHTFKLDLCSLESVRHCAMKIIEKFPHVNILINNAGYFGVHDFIQRTKDGHEKNLASNHLGHFLLTFLLLSHLKKGSPSRVISVGSVNYKWSSPDPNDLNLEHETKLGLFNVIPFARAKYCAMLFSKELAKRLEGTQVRTYSLCPDLVRTDFFVNLPWPLRRFFDTVLMNMVGATPVQGSETIMYCALSHICSQETGKIYRFARYWPEPEQDMDAELAEKVWGASEKLVGLRFDEINMVDFEASFLRRFRKNTTELGQGQKVIPMILGRAFKNKVAAMESIYAHDKLDLFV